MEYKYHHFLESSLQQEDIEQIANGKIDLSHFKNSKIFITGATGLVGSMLVKTFLCCNRIRNLNLQVIGMVRNIEKAKQYYGDILQRNDFLLYVGDVKNAIKYDGKVDYIFHTASVTTSKVMVNDPVGTIDTAYMGTKNVLDLAVNNNVKSVVYVSSMEVYGVPDSQMSSIREKDLGYVDLFKARSSYPEGKRICECLCTAYKTEYEVPVKIARLAQTFGPGISWNDNRVYAQIAKSVLRKEDIVLHSDGKSEGNYCYIKDTIEGLIIIAIKGINGEAYNVVNEKMHMEIREMAELVANRIAKDEISVRYEIPEDIVSLGYAPKVKMKLCGDKLKKLGWIPSVGMVEAYKRMISDLQSMKK